MTKKLEEIIIKLRKFSEDLNLKLQESLEKADYDFNVGGKRYFQTLKILKTIENENIKDEDTLVSLIPNWYLKDVYYIFINDSELDKAWRELND